MQLSVGDKAPDSILLDRNGEEVSLSELWQDGPTLFTMLRHYGCVFCRSWVAALGENHDDLIAAGFGQIAGVGIGQPKHAERVCGNRASEMMCLADATTNTHKSWGLERGNPAQMFSPKSIIAGTKATLAGHFPVEPPTGDPWMMPGTFIIDAQGIIQYAHYSTNPGDHPEIAELKAVVRELSNTQPVAE